MFAGNNDKAIIEGDFAVLKSKLQGVQVQSTTKVFKAALDTQSKT